MQVKHKPSERGQALIIIAFALVALIGITGLVVDGGMSYADRRGAQNAADAAVLAASLAKVRGENYVAAGLNSAATNGYNNDGVTNTVQIGAPSEGPYAGNTEYIQVTIVSHKDTFFSGVVGVSQITNTVQAMARARPSQVEPMAYGYALVSLAPTSDCQNKRAFQVHGEATIELWGGGIFVNAKDKDGTCAFMSYGSGSIVFMDRYPLNVVGGASIQKPQLIKLLVAKPVDGIPLAQQPNIFQPILPDTGALPLPYPPPFIMPDPSCGAEVAHVKPEVDNPLTPQVETGHVMTPGNWDPGNGKDKYFPPEGVDTLSAGIYCINGDVRIEGNQTVQGDNVLLFVEHGSVSIKGGATVNLSAPETGQFAGLLILLPMANQQRVALNGNAQSTFQGTILAPASEIVLNGNESDYGFHSQIIGYTIDVDGQSLIVLKYVDGQNYDATVSPEIQIIQ